MEQMSLINVADDQAERITMHITMSLETILCTLDITGSYYICKTEICWQKCLYSLLVQMATYLVDVIMQLLSCVCMLCNYEYKICTNYYMHV